MSATNTIKVRCPGCRAKYRIAAGAAGKKLRCSKCSQVFRISSPASPAAAKPDVVEWKHPPGIPTEDDICRWLMEGIDEDIPARPRIANVPQSSPVSRERHPNRKPSSVSVARSENAPRKAPSIVNDPQELADRSAVSTHDDTVESSPVGAHQDSRPPARHGLTLRKTA